MTKDANAAILLLIAYKNITQASYFNKTKTKQKQRQG